MIDQYLRLANLDDIPILLRFARNFHKASNYHALKFDMEKGRAFLKEAILRPDFVVIVALRQGNPIGFLVGAINEPVFSSARVAAELGWWIEPEHRSTRASVLIYSAYEDWAKRQGADCVQGAFLPGVSPALDEFYKKRGYLQVETSYIKTLRI